MKYSLAFFFFFVTFFSFAQKEPAWKEESMVFTPEIFFGKTMEANRDFPKTQLQKQLLFNIGRDHKLNPQQWAEELNAPKTGISFGLTDFGNWESLGLAITAMPFIEFTAFGSDRLKVLTGMGGSVFTHKHHPIDNPNNRAVTTDLTWAFKMNLYYDLVTLDNIDWRIGLGYSHHSNGHTRLLNQGYNSFLIGLSADVKKIPNLSKIVKNIPVAVHGNSVNEYVSIRSGLGQNVFALAYNDKKNVYTLSGEYGRVYKNTFKIGIGLYYRFYESYYDYIKENESLVREGKEFSYFKNNPWNYSTNLGVSINGEIFLNHVGIDLQVGLNLHKPTYQLEWRINEGWENTPKEIPEYWVLGELNTDYKIKYRLSTRLGLKYYLIGMENSPENNLYLGAHINANFSQADFSELSVGYVYSFNLRERN